MHPHRSLSILAGPLALLAACEAPPAPSQTFKAIVRAESDPGVPLAGVVIAHEGHPIGTSDERGALPLELSGPAGDTVALEVRCPAGFRRSGEPLIVVLRALADPAQRPEYRAKCRPELRTLVVSVRAENGPGIPLRYLGKELARTDAQGAAHALLQLPASESAKLVLDTSAPEHRYLRPQNPDLKLSMPDHDEVVLFDQPFRVDAPKPPPAPRPKPPELPIKF